MVLIRQWRDECCWSWEHETTQVWCRVEEVVSVLIMLLFKEKSFRTLNKITINEGRSWYQAETLNLGNMDWRWSPHTSNQHKIILIWMIFQEIIKNIFYAIIRIVCWLSQSISYDHMTMIQFNYKAMMMILPEPINPGHPSPALISPALILSIIGFSYHLLASTRQLHWLN